MKTTEPMTEKQKTLLRKAQKQLKIDIADDSTNRALAKNDLEFVAIEGAQWPAGIRNEREAENRPCITINKMPTFIDQVVGDQRMNRPAIQVIPVDSQADPEIAKILGGWIKHVEQISRSDVAIDHGFEHAVACGYGAWRVITKYVEGSFSEQEAYITKIDNALSVYWGKHSEYDCSDAQHCFIVSDMDRDEFKEKFNIDPMPFKSDVDEYLQPWAGEDTVRVAEYFVKEPKNETLYLLADGSTTTKLKKGEVSIDKRKTDSYTIMWYLLSGDSILASKEWVGKKYIPIVPIWGKEFNVAGQRVLRSLIRNAKDPQRLYNYWQSSDTETVAIQPKSPYILTPKQVQGHEQQWNQTNKKNYPYLLVNPDKDAPGWPQRQPPPQVSSAMVQKLRDSDQEIRDTVGIQKSSLGMQGNERSGAAIRENKREGDVGTFSFIDNLSRSLEHTGRILVDIAPSLLDTERIVRLGLDNGGFEFTKVNVEGENGEIFNDLSIGTYDVVVTVGPSFETQRTEAKISIQEFIQYFPQAAPVIGDVYAKIMDWPGADDLAERLKFLLPPELKAQLAAAAAKRAGEEAPPPAEPPAPPPDPVAEAKLKEAGVKLEEANVKLEQERVKLKEAEVKLEILKASSKEELRRAIEEVLAEGEGATDEKGI